MKVLIDSTSPKMVMSENVFNRLPELADLPRGWGGVHSKFSNFTVQESMTSNEIPPSIFFLNHSFICKRCLIPHGITSPKTQRHEVGGGQQQEANRGGGGYADSNS